MSRTSVSDLILKVASASKAPRGISLDALKKGLSAGGYDVMKNNFRVRLAVKRLVADGGLIQTKGTGACEAFKIIKNVEKKKAVKKANKPLAKKVKKIPAALAKKVKKKPSEPKKTPRKSKRKLRSPKKAKRFATKSNRRVRLGRLAKDKNSRATTAK